MWKPGSWLRVGDDRKGIAVPELPDVEIFQSILTATSLRQEMIDVKVLNRRVLNALSPSKLRQALVGRAFRSARRHGKYLFAEVDDSHWLVLHFGMTGCLDYGVVEESGPHDRVLFVFASGCRLAYVCPRLFGRIALTESVDRFVHERKLGPDAMHIGAEEFAVRVRRSKATVKARLMDQSCIAGVGNLYSDETLFQSSLHPAFPCHRLTIEQGIRLHRDMRKVLRMAIRRKADPWAMPPSYLLPHRKPDGCCPTCDTGLTRDTVAGRTTYWCPQCQRM